MFDMFVVPSGPCVYCKETYIFVREYLETHAIL